MLNFNKTYFAQFITKKSSIIDKNINCDIKPVTNIINTNASEQLLTTPCVGKVTLTK